MSDTIFSAADIVGKTLYANAAVTAVNASGAPLFTIAKNNPVGVVYSWIIQDNGALWWMFYDENDTPYYVKHTQGLFNVSDLVAQGVLTPLQKIAQAAEDNKPWWEKLGDNLQHTITTVLIAGVVVYGVVQIVKVKSGSKKQK